MYRILTILFILVLSSTSIIAADLGKNFSMKNPIASQLMNKEILVAPGISMQVGDFILKSNFKVLPQIKPYFNPTFERKFLTKPAQYFEEVKAIGDRLVVTRTLILDLKNPCDSRMQAYGTTSLCFQKKPKQKNIPQKEIDKFHAEMNNIRAKAKQVRPNDPETLKVLKMDDDTLFDYLINKRSKQKKIIHESVLPLAVYKNIKQMQPINLLQPNFIVPTQGLYKPSVQKNASLLTTQNVVLDNNKKVINRPTVKREMTFDEFKIINSTDTPPEPITFNTHKEEKYNFLLGNTWGKYDGDYKKYVFAEEGWFTDQYYAKFTYSFGFGFGLRWPFELTVKSDITDVEGFMGSPKSYPQTRLCNDVETNDRASECAIKANVSFKAKGVNANESFYQSTGLAQDKIFNAKEFVFTAQVNMKFKISIPGPNISYNPSGIDFDYGEHFIPPLGAQSEQIVDFLLYPNQTGLKISGDIGVAEVYGGLDIGAFITASNGEFRIAQWGDKSRNNCDNDIVLNSVNNTVTCQATENIRANTSDKWGLSLQFPRYKTDFVITPQVGLRIGVWVLGWDWSYSPGAVPLTALKVDLGTFYFSAHHGTTASFIYEIATRTKK